METLRVSLGKRSYDIHVAGGILDGVGRICRDLGLGRHAAVVTNTTVGPLYYDRIATALAAAGFTHYRIEVPDGEEYKNSATLNGIYDELIAAGLTRDAFIVALGGGVVGDMAGFAAATFCAAFRSSRCRPRSWPRSTAVSAGKPGSITLAERI